ncbi:hypothetical protein LIA77_10766 [Sarocladium implicatum]|nr:hypothetical protein LIA77_10766 [Sarocladium implicatum]
MPAVSSLRALFAAALVSRAAAWNFTIHNGQIFTPGFTVLNAPQPETPMGGDDLHISLDVTANGKLPLADFDEDDPSQIFNVTLFLYSYRTERNFTISNGTATANNASFGNIMQQEPGSTVKHINWVWPDCLVGNGQPDSDDSDRGVYNISIRQNFRLNDTDYYTIFDVPISVTNSIEEDDDRPSCDSLDNELLSPEEIDMETANEVGVLFAPGRASEVDVGDLGDKNSDGNDDKDGNEEGLGGTKNRAGTEDGLGDEDAAVNLGLNWVSLAAGLGVCAAVVQSDIFI